MTTIEDRWREGLQAVALEIDLPAGGAPVERIQRRGARRRHRNQAVGALACVAMVGGSFAAWDANRAGRGGERPTDLRIADETGEESTVTTVAGVYDGRQVDPSSLPAVTLVPSPLAWRAEPVPFGTSVSAMYGWATEGGADGLVAVSTRPGVRRSTDDEGFAVYQSADGVTWSSVGETGPDRWFGSVTKTASGLVAVGTAAATAPIERNDGGNGVGDVVVSYADTEGKGWKDVVLPIDLRGARQRAIDAGFELSLGVAAAKVVVTGDVTTVAVSVSGTPRDITGLLASAGVPIESVSGMTGEGVQADGRLRTWAELGLDPGVAAVMGTRTFLYRSNDGATFVALGAGLADATVQDMAALGDQVALLFVGQFPASRDNPIQLGAALVAADGTVSTMPAPPLERGQFRAGSLGGRFTIAGTQGGWPALSVWDGSAWTTQVLANGVVRDGTNLGVTQAVVGDGGVAFVLYEQDDPSAGLEVTDRGYTLRSLGGQRGIALYDDAGTEVTRWSSVYDVTNIPGIDVVRGEPTPGMPGPSTTSVGRAMLVAAKGDTASGIAERLGIPLDDLRRANPDVDLDRLQAGQELNVPVSGPTATTMPGGVEGSVPLAIEVVDAGGVKARLDLAELNRRMEAVWNVATPPEHRTLLLHSLDGVSWSLTDLAELTGTPVQMTASIVSTADGLVVTAITTDDDPGAPDPTPDMPTRFKTRVALVGTRR